MSTESATTPVPAGEADNRHKLYPTRQLKRKATCDEEDECSLDDIPSPSSKRPRTADSSTAETGTSFLSPVRVKKAPVARATRASPRLEAQKRFQLSENKFTKAKRLTVAERVSLGDFPVPKTAPCAPKKSSGTAKTSTDAPTPSGSGSGRGSSGHGKRRRLSHDWQQVDFEKKTKNRTCPQDRCAEGAAKPLRYIFLCKRCKVVMCGRCKDSDESSCPGEREVEFKDDEDDA